MELAPLDDELFESYGVTRGVRASIPREVKKNMERELRNAVQNHVKQQVMDAIVGGTCRLDVPRR